MTDTQDLSSIHTSSADTPLHLALDADIPTCSPPDSISIVANRGQKARVSAKFVRVRTQLNRLIANTLRQLFDECNRKISFNVPESGGFDGRVSRWLIEGDLIDVTGVSFDFPGAYDRGVPLLSVRIGFDIPMWEFGPDLVTDAQTLAAILRVKKMLAYLFEHLITLDGSFGNDQYWALKCAEEWLNTKMVTNKLQSFVCASS
jgi:hypothetical protein